VRVRQPVQSGSRDGASGPAQAEHDREAAAHSADACMIGGADEGSRADDRKRRGGRSFTGSPST